MLFCILEIILINNIYIAYEISSLNSTGNSDPSSVFVLCQNFCFHYWCFRMQIIVLKANYFLESDNMFPINGFKTLAWSHHFTTSGYLDTLASLTLPHLLKCLCAYLCSTHSVLCFVLFLFFLCILSCQFLWMICF